MLAGNTRHTRGYVTVAGVTRISIVEQERQNVYENEIRTWNSSRPAGVSAVQLL
jgi:hypothetical protein